MTTYKKTLDKMEGYANGTLLLSKISDSDLSNILVALDKQISKKPKKLTYTPLLNAGWIYECPKCGCACGENKYHPEVTCDDMYCTQCGQKINWGE